MGRVELTASASHTLTVLSLLAVYSTPLFPTPFALVPAPPHLTTLTDAVCPPSVYSVRRVRRDQTLTVKSLEEEASLGEEGLLMKISKKKRNQNKIRIYKWIGSHASDVIHFEWPLSASPIGLPVFGSHIRTYVWLLRARGWTDGAKKNIRAHRDHRSQVSAPSPPTRRTTPSLYGPKGYEMVSPNRDSTILL